MLPSVDWMICATPRLPLPAWVEESQFTVSPRPNVHVPTAALVRKPVKLLVVPEPSDRCTTVIDVLGRVTPGLSAAMAGSFQFLICTWKILASVAGLNWRSFWFFTLNETVMGAAT